MKIAILTSEFPPFQGGIATYAVELARAAVALGHEVTVLAPDYAIDVGRKDATQLYRICRFPGGPASVRGLPKRILVTRPLLAQQRYDIVHAVDWPFFVALRLSPRQGARVILSVHGSDILYMRGPHRRAVLEALGFWRRDRAQWIANSEYTADLLAAELPVARSAVRAIPLAVADDWTAGQMPRAAARARFEIDPHDRVIVSLGRLVPRKGHLDLADALALLSPATAQRVRWWVIGTSADHAHIATLQARLATLGVRAEVLGPLSRTEVQMRLSAADLFCLPGYRDRSGKVEGFGLVFLEAAAYGIPAVATRSGGIAESVIDGVSGVLVPERDTPALAKALARLIEDDSYRALLADGARAHAAARRWAEVAGETYR